MAKLSTEIDDAVGQAKADSSGKVDECVAIVQYVDHFRSQHAQISIECC